MSRRRKRDLVVRQKAPQTYQSVDDARAWMTLWSGTGYTPWQLTQGFQLDIDMRPDRLQTNWVVFACQTLIAGDIGKLRVALVEKVQGVWQETESSAYDRLLRKPNTFQTWQQFIESWSHSKQRRGNAYILLGRDQSTRVNAMYVLDPDRVTPLIALDGSVYYRLTADDLASVQDEVVVPASEIMHDRFNCLFHPLVGLSPLYACALAAASGLTMQEQSALFFRNGSRPGGLLTTPGTIQDKDIVRYKTEWETNFAGGNTGRTAVLGNGLKYEAIRENSVDSEIVKLLDMSAYMVCSTHHVPAYKVGVGPVPIQSAAEVLNQVYYDTCLQTLIEAIEALLDEGLELESVGTRKLRTRFDLNDLIRMDNGKLVEKLKNEVGAGITSPNEARAALGRGPKDGGDSPMLQQQNYSIAALAKRDAKDDPFGAAKPAAAEPPTPAANDDDAEPSAEAKAAFLARANAVGAQRMKDIANAN